jgi:hypothetical protein
MTSEDLKKSNVSRLDNSVWHRRYRVRSDHLKRNAYQLHTIPPCLSFPSGILGWIPQWFCRLPYNFQKLPYRFSIRLEPLRCDRE